MFKKHTPEKIMNTSHSKSVRTYLLMFSLFLIGIPSTVLGIRLMPAYSRRHARCVLKPAIIAENKCRAWHAYDSPQCVAHRAAVEKCMTEDLEKAKAQCAKKYGGVYTEGYKRCLHDS